MKGDVLLAYSVPSPTVNNYISGDVNGDNLVNAKDLSPGVLVETAQVGAGLSTGFTSTGAAADFNSDGAVNIRKDLLL